MKKAITILLLVLSLNIFGQCWQTVAGGLAHSIGVKTDGTLWGWGLNTDDQLAGNTNSYSAPFQIGSGNNWQSASCGRDYSVAIKSNGTLWGWGNNYYGQLGVNADPIIHTVHNPRQIGTASNWKSVTAGEIHIVAIKLDGTLWAMGNNGSGNLGDGTNINRTVMVQIGTDTSWESVSVKGYHTIAKKTDGTIWTWGLNNMGQLGDGTIVNRNVPTQIGVGSSWQSIAAGFYHTIAIKTDGTLWTWGYNNNGQLGDGTYIDKNVPVQIGTSNDWQSATGGYDYTIVKKTDASIRLWGSNSLGQLSSSPSQFSVIHNWQTLACGHYHNLYIKDDGSLWTWGPNWNGQLGDGTYVSRDNPASVACPTSLGIDEFENSHEMVIYPNPVKNSFKIENGEAITMVKIYDIKGTVVKMLETNFNEAIDVSNLRQGIYLLKVDNDSGRVYSKLLIKE